MGPGKHLSAKPICLKGTRQKQMNSPESLQGGPPTPARQGIRSLYGE